MASPEQIARQLSGLLSSGQKRQLVQRMVLIAERHSKREAPVKSGNLRRTVTSRVLSAERGEVGTNASYARAVHDGTRPHVIRPKRAKALFWQGARHPVRVVNHPGSKANPFFERALRMARPEIDREAAAWGVKVFASVG